ncbi:hypothetical protein RhiirA1_472978 [Rhizophagus irregularis]|uniref:Uncharacterized protein n=1 Tax=Rhizophagus irregularis TaxID=588596 RepID=A0A2N0R1E6_9GLOM|nr:hypothetical protein RhiirA1_472978 [Rhizophagus irregularis]
MSTESTCSFNSTDCKETIKSITNNTRISITQKKFILAAHNLKNNETCSHPKHNEYKNKNAKICSLCRKKTDSDPDYNMLEEYNAPISRKQDDSDNILKVRNYTYSFRKDVLYTGEELKQIESDYQEMMA